MDVVLTCEKIVKTAAGAAVYGAVGFGVGAVVGLFANASVLKTGAVFAVGGVATYALSKLVGAIGKKCNWNKSSITLLKGCSTLVVSIAEIATCVALGILGPLGVAILGGFALISFVSFVNVATNQRRQEPWQQLA